MLVGIVETGLIAVEIVLVENCQRMVEMSSDLPVAETVRLMVF